MNAKPPRMLFAAIALSALAAVLTSSAQARIPEGNGTRPPSGTVVDEQQTLEGSGTLFVDPVYASLDPAIRIAIVRRSHARPLAAKAGHTRRGKQRLEKFPAGYRGLP